MSTPIDRDRPVQDSGQSATGAPGSAPKASKAPNVTESTRAAYGRAGGEFAKILFREPGDVVEVRALGVKDVRGSGVVSGYFDNPDDLAQSVSEVDGRAKGVFVTLNPVSPELLSRAPNRLERSPKATTADDDIVSRRFLLIDIDPVRPSGVSATDAEKQHAFGLITEVRSHLTDLGFPAPALADSGNGGHLLYPVELPADDGGLVQRILRALAFRFDTKAALVDQSVYNPARIVKLYGTMACKGDSTSDRPHRRSKLIDVPESFEVVSTELLEKVAAICPVVESLRAPAANGQNSNFDVQGFIAKHHIEITRHGEWKGGYRWVLAVCPFNADHTDGSAFIIQFASGAIAAGCHHNGCQGKGWFDLRNLYEPNRQFRQKRIGGEPSMESPLELSEEDAEHDATVERERVDEMIFKPFPTDALPYPFNELAVQGAKALGCDPSLIVLPLFSGLAAAIGNTRKLLLGPEWDEPPILLTAVVSPSGTLKTPAQKLALVTVFSLESEAAAEWDASKAQRNAAEDERDAKNRAYLEVLKKKKKAEQGDGADKNLKLNPTAPEPFEETFMVRRVIKDTTAEALLAVLAREPHGLLSARDELAGWLGSHGEYKNGGGGDVGRWLEMYDAGDLQVDRKGDPAPLHINRAAVCITGGIQPGVLRELLTETNRENGLAARLLIAEPPDVYRPCGKENIEKTVKDAAVAVFRDLYSEKVVMEKGRPVPVERRLSKAARVRWDAHVDEHRRIGPELQGHLKAAWAKLTGATARIALVIHEAKIASGLNAPTEWTVNVALSSMEEAIKITDFFRYEARRFYAAAKRAKAAVLAVELRTRATEILDRFEGSCSTREWRRANTRLTTAEAKAELQEVVDAGLAEWSECATGPKGGRPSKKCVVFFTPLDVRAETPPSDPATRGFGIYPPEEESPNAKTPTEDPATGGFGTHSLEDEKILPGADDDSDEWVVA